MVFKWKSYVMNKIQDNIQIKFLYLKQVKLEKIDYK